MSARRSSQPPVQLFPFLAVLMCALGALILILLVATARIRDQARARAARPDAGPAAVIATPLPIARVAVSPRAAWKPLMAPPDVTLQPIPATAEPEPLPQPTESLREQWLRTVMDLEAAAAAEDAALQARRAAAETNEAALQATSTQLVGLQQKAETIAEHRLAAEAELTREQQRRADLQRTIAERQSALKQLQQQQAAGSRFSILPYDGRTGTVRRPIYIECTETGLTFASEGITLTPEQLNGFPSFQNPLRAGSDALIDYWSLKGLKDAAHENVGAPYVLLIVRPRGTVAYYVARRMLESLGQPFGYELVPDDLEMQWPASDEGAVKTCRAAIDAVLQNRERLTFHGGVAVPGSLEPLSVADGQGRFALEEVERLRGGGRMVHFGGREFDRSASGSSAAPPRSGGPAPGVHSSMDDTRSDAEPSGGEPAPFPSGALSERGAGAERGFEAASRAGSPVDASRSAAAESASAFSSSAARSGQRSSEQSGGATPGGRPGDSTPRPLASLDALEQDHLAPARKASRNPADVLRDPGSQIGMERKIVIRVEPQQVVIESEPAIAVVAGMSREELQAALAESLRTHFAGWGRPPRGFYWLPRVKYSVLPGGHQHVKRLQDLTKEWEIASEIDFALE